jgi:hypothetical protein
VPAPEPIYAQKALTFDDIVVSGGRAPRTDLAQHLQGLAPIVKVVGDTVTVSNLKNATYSGYKAAMEL